MSKKREYTLSYKLEAHILRRIILDCWELLQVKPKQKSPWLSTRLRNEELIENQEELINQLKETLEPVVNKIQTEGEN